MCFGTNGGGAFVLARWIDLCETAAWFGGGYFSERMLVILFLFCEEFDDTFSQPSSVIFVRVTGFGSFGSSLLKNGFLESNESSYAIPYESPGLQVPSQKVVGVVLEGPDTF